MLSSSQDLGVPVLVGADGGGQPLERVALSALNGSTYDEAWLQRLVDSNPACLPIDQIEPGLPVFFSVCRALATSNGYIDNLLMTPGGDIAIVETKLFRNPQARRAVLAQVLDYATALFSMDYAAFEKAVLTATFAPRIRPVSLYTALTSSDQPDEQLFVDAVVRNLRRGRILIIIAGDGIRSETEILFGGLERFARFQFTLALVELAVYRLPQPKQFIVRPRTLARTETIRRYVYELAPAGAVPADAGFEDRNGSIGSDAYWRALEASAPGARAPLEKLIDAVAEFGVRPEYRASLNLRWDRPDADRPVNIGYISKNGTFWFDTVALYVPKSLALDYINDVAAAFGAEVHQFPGSQNWTIYQHSKPLRIKHNLGQLAAWAPAIEKFITAIKKHDSAES